MKIIGLLGGTSWPSTPLYYTYLNEAVARHMGGHHSARIILYSIDYHPIKTLYPNGWDEITLLLGQELSRLDEMGPDCILICNNSLHKAYDMLVEKQMARYQSRIIHIVTETAKACVARGDKCVLLLGTKFTMEDGFFEKHLRFFGLDVAIPDEKDRAEIQRMQSLISAGQGVDIYRPAFAQILSRYTDYDSVILGCTELPMVIGPQETHLPIVNPIHAQCDAALKFYYM